MGGGLRLLVAGLFDGERSEGAGLFNGGRSEGARPHTSVASFLDGEMKGEEPKEGN